MKRLRTLKLFQTFRTKIKKQKTYSGLCPFQGLSNGTTLQSGLTVPLTLFYTRGLGIAVLHVIVPEQYRFPLCLLK